MREAWSWKRRKQCLFVAKVVAWALYLCLVALFVCLAFPGAFSYPVATAIFIGAFIAMPCLAQLIWIFNPGYYFRSALRITPDVTGHIIAPRAESRLRNLSGESGLPPEGRLVAVKTEWDHWLFAGVAILGSRDPGPKTSGVARLELTRQRVRVSAGMWRPGVVLDFPMSRVVGLWTGTDVETIGGDRVLVLVVETDERPLLLPFQVNRWSSGTTSSRRVAELVDCIERVAGRTRKAAGGTEGVDQP